MARKQNENKQKNRGEKQNTNLNAQTRENKQTGPTQQRVNARNKQTNICCTFVATQKQQESAKCCKTCKK